jgi:TRAP-type C4-dicarboxylate transport system substrate-binding protein
MPKGKGVGAAFDWWATEFEKRTQGRYKVETYASSTLISLPAALDSVKAGVAEVVMLPHQMFPTAFPLSSIASLPTLGFPMLNTGDYYVFWSALWDLYNNYPEIKTEFKNFKLLWPFGLDPYCLITKDKEVHNPTDFKGMKVGGSGQLMEIVTTNGGAAVAQVPPMAYTNMEKGVTEGSFLTLGQAWDYHIEDISKYYYRENFGNGLILMTMNLAAWNAMSPQDQKIMEESWFDASREFAKASVDAQSEGIKAVQAKGRKIIQPTADETKEWERGAEPAILKWRDDAVKLQVDSTTIDKILAAWKALRVKYIKK